MSTPPWDQVRMSTPPWDQVRMSTPSPPDLRLGQNVYPPYLRLGQNVYPPPPTPRRLGQNVYPPGDLVRMSTPPLPESWSECLPPLRRRAVKIPTPPKRTTTRVSNEQPMNCDKFIIILFVHTFPSSSWLNNGPTPKG